MKHYKLPLDDEVDKDILDWINSFPRNKKGEMVRHAIRYYMSELEEGETIIFPSTTNSSTEKNRSQTKVKEVKKEEKVRPRLNLAATVK